MDYYCKKCNIFIRASGKYKLFWSITHDELDKCKHIKLTFQNPDKNDVDRAFYAYIIQHNKKYALYFIICEFKLCFNVNQYCPYNTFNLSNNKTMCSWQNILVKAIIDCKNKGHKFNYITELNILTIANNLDISYGFYNNHNLPAAERKLNAMINKIEHLIKKPNRIWQHLLMRKIEHVPVSNE